MSTTERKSMFSQNKQSKPTGRGKHEVLDDTNDGAEQSPLTSVERARSEFATSLHSAKAGVQASQRAVVGSATLAQSKVKRGIANARETVDQGTERLKMAIVEGGQATTNRMVAGKDKMVDVALNVRDEGQKALATARRGVRQKPLLAVSAGLAVGAAVGLALKATLPAKDAKEAGEAREE
jgi:ElaB/YqjD/DUF883 family membrane-anchored ribosome-binding protein